MDELYESSRPRVTASMLPRHIGQYVTMMGTVDPSRISSDGSSFQLTVDKNTHVEVVLNTLLNEMLDEVIEVTGKVDSQCHLQCVVYRKLKSSVPFSFEDYNATVEMIDKFPSCYSYSS